MVALALTERFAPNDTAGKPIEGRTFVYDAELLAPGDRNANWLRRPTPTSLAAVFPRRAMLEHKDGKAAIRCDVTVEGYLDRCEVRSETPEGYGFGQAALLLSSQFAMTPKIRNGKPVVGDVVIPIDWTGLATADVRPGRSVIRDPVWSVAPTSAAVDAVYPSAAAAIPAGQAALRCRLDAEGRLYRCQVTSESPPSKGFGAAASKLAPSFVAAVRPGEPAPKDLLVEIPFRFRNPTAPDNNRLTDVKWVQTLSEAGANQLYPQVAKGEGVSAGMGQVDCVATADGSLADCGVAKEEPAGKGFGQAALEAAKLMKMNPWTHTGDPVEGRQISIPIRFKLDASEPPAEEVRP
ncbi:MAG: hypothetical protein BGN86_15405 [Caulobacterales bacterium 68-7]|nr:MAG: hypothetical protein BGN86_15405 [Caulobacterales bacterium 68-7]